MKGLKAVGSIKVLSDLGFASGESKTLLVHDIDIGTVISIDIIMVEE